MTHVMITIVTDITFARCRPSRCGGTWWRVASATTWMFVQFFLGGHDMVFRPSWRELHKEGSVRTRLSGWVEVLVGGMMVLGVALLVWQLVCNVMCSLWVPSKGDVCPIWGSKHRSGVRNLGHHTLYCSLDSQRGIDWHEWYQDTCPLVNVGNSITCK